MALLIVGLLLFLGAHSVRLFADNWRAATIARIGAGPWKGLYTLVSVAGFVLIIWGYAAARRAPVDLWWPPAWTYSVAAVLSAVSFVLIAAAYVPRNHFKEKIGHPMVAGVKVWALAHLISNGRLADVLLFGGFLVWAVLMFTHLRRRDRAAAVTYPAGTVAGDVIAVASGVAIAVLFAWRLHAWLIGVQPV
jgi:uncharacterized membrane protein